jgi:hypothetical protein
MAGAASAVDPEAGRKAADIIKAAVQRQVPVLRVSKAAVQAGITDVGWHRAIKTGRGYESTFLAMARVAGVEPEVREALGLPPLDEIAARDPFEDAIMAAPQLSSEEKSASIRRHRQKVREAALKHLESLGIDPPAESALGS